MKALFIITQSSWGGAQKYVHTFAVNLAKNNNIAVTVAGGEESVGELTARLQEENIKFLPLKRLVRRISLINDLLAVKEIKTLIEQERPDVVHLNSSKAGAVGSLAAKLARHRAKVVYTVHGWVFNESLNPLTKLFYFLIEKSFAGFKDYFICLSDFDRQAGLKAKIAPAEKLIIVRNGIDLPADYFLAKEGALGELLKTDDSATVTKNNDKLIIGTIANFYPAKGLNYLIDAVSLLPVADYKLIIIGEGELRKELEQQIKRLKLEANIILAGNKKEAARYLKAFDLAVMSSTKEGLPYFILEAMSAGLPVIAAKVGGIPEIIDNGVTGYLIEPRSPERLAEKIKLLADEKLRKQFGEAGLIKVKKEFNLREMIEKTIEAYRK
ncbi:MAG: glycosyltransferase family 4 protein [Patescibacteria group bacterium]|jgi:glycosyltransferase involved in cell wall biosynthesis